jgi:hypothetical protein
MLGLVGATSPRPEHLAPASEAAQPPITREAQ